MTQLFRAPKAPVVPPAAPPPQITDPEVEEARKRAQELDRRQKGRAATLLTGGLGDTSPAPVQRATLLGA